MIVRLLPDLEKLRNIKTESIRIYTLRLYNPKVIGFYRVSAPLILEYSNKKYSYSLELKGYGLNTTSIEKFVKGKYGDSEGRFITILDSKAVGRPEGMGHFVDPDGHLIGKDFTDLPGWTNLVGEMEVPGYYTTFEVLRLYPVK